MNNGVFRLNPATSKKFKRGDWNEEKTKKFWSYRVHVKKDGEFAEVWLDEKKYDERCSHDLDKQRKKKQTNRAIGKPKRINPKTGVKFKTGDYRHDGYRFIKYAPEDAQRHDGYMAEIYASPKGWVHNRIRTTFYKIKKRAKEKNLSMKISADFLISIFPKDSICPVLGIEMEFGGDTRMNSPSVDRLIPELGYVPENIVWVCQEANLLKSDRTSSELRAIADWIEQQPIYQSYNE